MALGVLILEGPLDSADARLIRRGAHGLIRVKQDIPESGRKRFAIAHELGHWLLHRNLSQVLACTSEDMVAKYKASIRRLKQTALLRNSSCLRCCSFPAFASPNHHSR